MPDGKGGRSGNATDDACRSTPVPADWDGDGWRCGNDCDDADPDVYPGAPDVPTDGKDSNCDGAVEKVERG